MLFGGRNEDVSEGPENLGFFRRHRGMVAAAAVGGIATLAIIAETQEDYAPDNFSDMNGVQVESISVLHDPLTAFARAVHGDWRTGVHPGSVNNVIAHAKDQRLYYIDTKASQALNQQNYPDLDAQLEPGVHHIQLTPPQIQPYTKNDVMLTYGNLPPDVKERYTDDEGAVIEPLFNAIEAANREAVQADGLVYPSPGMYPLFSADLTDWTDSMPAMTSPQVDKTWQQAAEMLQNGTR